MSGEVVDDCNEPMARYVVNVLLDHYTDVLQVPSSLVAQINALLLEKTRPSQVVAGLDFSQTDY